MKQKEKHRGELKLVRIPTISASTHPHKSSTINGYSVGQNAFYSSLKKSRTSNIGNNQLRTLMRNPGQLMSAMKCTLSTVDTKTLQRSIQPRYTNKEGAIMQSHHALDSDSYALQRCATGSLKQSLSSLSSINSQKNTSSNFQNVHKNELKEEMKQKSSAAISRPQSAAISQQLKKKASKLDSLINDQSSVGNWNSAKLIFSFLNENLFAEDLERDITQMIKDKNLQKQVLLTILALFILKEIFDDKEDEWVMIAKKAKTYLREQGIEKVDQFYKKYNVSIKE
ncbi:UNKNOWN [Stylonychia lemnae]|uniref:Uncharacterized protein n=1 Tax=Stylonychia lemnae TaxID=5949 RepID=A0A077ZVV5_STYLE|nr:UNKNOWN [Stylonychia lemnae]|eukprot:CDW74004.1 UNKNOWN [Stylonychia lemnae]